MADAHTGYKMSRVRSLHSVAEGLWPRAREAIRAQGVQAFFRMESKSVIIKGPSAASVRRAGTE